jgi:hypothetical protein
MAKKCISCGMPLEKEEDFPGGDESKDYCVYCARADGTMKSYEEALEGMTQFTVRTQGLDPAAARTTVKGMMAKLPAWRDHATGEGQ